MKLKLVDPHDKILREPTREFPFGGGEHDPKELAEAMAEFMVQSGGIGLAANQVGIPYRVFVIKSDPVKAFFNPKIVDRSESLIMGVEGCLTFPGMAAKIKRSKDVRIRYQGWNGEVFTEQFTLLTARVIQHEIDHLDGVLFYERCHPYHREKAFKSWKGSKK